MQFAFSQENVLSLLKAIILKEKYPEAKFTFFKKSDSNFPIENWHNFSLRPGDDFFRFLPANFISLLKTYLPELEVREISLKKIPPLSLKDGYLVKYPAVVSQIYRSSLLFFTEKLKLFFAMRKKYSLWGDIPLFEAAKNLLGEGFAEYIVSPLSRYRFLCEAEDIELATAFPEFYKTLQEGKKPAHYYESIRSQELKLLKLNLSFKEMELMLSEKLQGSLVRQNFSINRYRGRGSLIAGSREFGPYERVFVFLRISSLRRLLEKDFSSLLENIGIEKFRETQLSSVYFLYPEGTFPTQRGGIILPRKEKYSFYFAEFLSELFPEQYGGSKQLIRVVIPGKTDVLGEKSLQTFAQEGLKRIFKLKAEPLQTTVFPQLLQFDLPSSGYSRAKEELYNWAKTDRHISFLPDLSPYLSERDIDLVAEN
ncbi:MAG: hypothetical protein NZM25_00365 [Leptospiraceae bacterium]|nr:hypothetical protein [Leptospiraceae bacterium]MDW8306177.1 hypothetical protein [Leptospiraceae bacterium]